MFAYNMSSFRIKLRHILPRFLLITLGTVAFMAIARWVLEIHFQVTDMYDENWSVWIPLILPWIPLTIWFRKCNRILVFGKSDDNDRPRLFPQIIAYMIMFGMIYCSQNYLVRSTGKILPLDSALVTGIKPDARYYPHELFAVDFNYAGTSTQVEFTDGKRDQYLDYTIYYVAPMNNLDTGGTSVNPECWYGLKFTKRINSNYPVEFREKVFDSFYNECIENLVYNIFDSITYFERVPSSEDRDWYLAAIGGRIERVAGNEHIILEPRHKPLKDRTGNYLMWTFVILGSGIFILIVFLFFAGFSGEEYNLQTAGKTGEDDDILKALNYLIPRGDHFVTSIIIDINIIILLTMVFSGAGIISFEAEALLKWGANERTVTTGGEWWRLLSSTFIHGTPLHLMLNIFGLVMAQILLEPVIGRARYATIYILSAICASLLSTYWYESNTVSVGASGAIFGLYGAVLALLFTKAYPPFEKESILLPVAFFTGINLIWGLSGGIDNAAHIGGLISGAVLGPLLFRAGGLVRRER